MSRPEAEYIGIQNRDVARQNSALVRTTFQNQTYSASEHDNNSKS